MTVMMLSVWAIDWTGQLSLAWVPPINFEFFTFRLETGQICFLTIFFTFFLFWWMWGFLRHIFKTILTSKVLCIQGIEFLVVCVISFILQCFNLWHLSTKSSQWMIKFNMFLQKNKFRKWVFAKTTNKWFWQQWFFSCHSFLHVVRWLMDFQEFYSNSSFYGLITYAYKYASTEVRSLKGLCNFII